MERHIRLLGIFQIIYGSISLLIGLLVFLFLTGLAGFLGSGFVDEPDAARAAPILSLIGIGVGLLLAVLSAPSIITGIGLLQMKSWSRILGIVMSALHLLSVPLGTALGIYGFWVLFNPEVERLLAPPPGPVARTF